MEKPTPWRANSPQVSRFTDGKLPARLGNRQGGETNDREQSSLYLVAADEGEHFEQSRAYRFSRDCDTRGMNERSGFHTTRLGRSAQCGLDRDRIERGQRLERGRKREEMFPHSVDPHVPGDRSFVVRDRVREEEATLRDEVAEPPRPRLEQLEHRKKPRVPISKIRVVPEIFGSEPRLQTSAELVRREPRHVLLVEPIELLGIEHGVAAADALDRKRVDELLAREELAIVAGRP